MHHYRNFLGWFQTGLLRIRAKKATIYRKQYVRSEWVILAISIAIATIYNQTLWVKLIERIDVISVKSVVFSLSLLLLHVGLLVLLFSPFNRRYFLKPFAILIVSVSALIAYFNGLGIVIDKSMLINMLETDTKEAFELLSAQLLFKCFLFSVIPSVVIYNFPISYPKRKVGQLWSWSIAGVLIVISGGLVYANYQYTTFFGRENNDLSNYLNPTFSMAAAVRLGKDQLQKQDEFTWIGNDAKQIKHSPQRTVGIFVVGETARADHFGINGYKKNTTPNLSEINNLHNFKDVTSCGTSTAFSVPCMFSFLSVDEYTPRKAKSQSNVLDVLQKAGVKTIWRDNNSDCKGVCSRIETQNFRRRIDITSTYYHDGTYVDEILISELDQLIDNNPGDLLIVLHQLGSHGPAYHRRYPEKFKKFTPTCESDSPQNCTIEQVQNSYDNTILYTDYVVGKAIKYLQSNKDKYQSFLLYASDHGESLGESGIYLHGLPRNIAPRDQRHIPMVLWLSNNNRLDTGSVNENLSRCETQTLNHDVLSHTLLSMFEVTSAVYDDALSLVGKSCTTNVAKSR